MAIATFRKDGKWAYVDEVYGNGRKYGYYVAAGNGTNNNYKAQRNFKLKSLAVKYAKSLVK
jgi:hypothetical protein